MRKLRPDEKFIIGKLADSLGPEASWWPGEDPPDCYLKVGERVIAVEISTLPQLVLDDHGKFVPRRSQDTKVSRICKGLNAELGHSLPEGTALFLHLEAPIKKATRFEYELSDFIKVLIRDIQNAELVIEREILSNRIEIRVMKNEKSYEKRIIGAVGNRRSSPYIFENAKRTLDERIRVKEEKRKSLNFPGPTWLALFADYWLATPDTYKDAMRESDVVHGFERIFLVDHVGTVVQLF